MKDAVATMGGLLPDDAGGRDAVHVAVFAAISEGTLHPGEHVAIIAKATQGTDILVTAYLGDKPRAVGIVDPFLTTEVRPGQRFWVYLYPRTITGLSHQWTHPAFENINTTYSTPATKLESEKWLKAFCKARDCPGYEQMIEVLTKMANGVTEEGGKHGYYDDYCGWSVDHEYLHFSGRDAHGTIPSEFWRHAEIVIGKEIKTKPSYFSCSC